MKNPARSYVLRDIWFEGLSQVIEEEATPDDNKPEMLFLTLSNALLDMVMDIVPADVGDILAENIDDFLCITMVNREHDLDLLAKFKEDFVAEKGDTFEDEIDLQNALTEFEDSGGTRSERTWMISLPTRRSPTWPSASTSKVISGALPHLSRAVQR